MLRLASSSSSTIRAIAASRILSASTNANPFSTAATNSIDHKLTVPAAPVDFPFTFHKYREHDPQFKENAYMRRDFNGEKIIATILKPKTIKEDLSFVVAAAGSTEPDPGVCLPEPLYLDVKIVKRRGKLSVQLWVEICPHELQVLMISFREQSHGHLISHGLHELEGEGELQCALQEYLKIRGIKPCYAEFMYRYMVWRSKKGSLEMLEKMKTFLKD